MENIKVKHVEVRPYSGSHVFHAIRESIMYAMQNETDVVLTHNDVEYKIDYNEVIDFIDDREDWEKRDELPF